MSIVPWLETIRRAYTSNGGWRRGVVVSGVRRMNEVNALSGPVSTGMGDRLRGPVYRLGM